MSAVHETLSPLGNPRFRSLWIGQMLSAFGSALTPVALALVTLQRGGTASDLGLVMGAQSAGLIGFVLVGGHLADRYPRLAVMAWSDVVRLCAAAALALTGGSFSLWVFMLSAFALGVGGASFVPAERAVLPAIVSEEEFESANSLNTLASRAALLAGPPIGAALVTNFDPRIAFWVDALTFLASIVSILLIRSAVDRQPTGTPSAEGVLSEAAAGFRAVRRRPWVAAVIVQGAVQVLLVHAPMAVLLPLVLSDRRQLGAYGLVLTAQAAGALAGAVVAPRLSRGEPGTVALLGMLVGLPLWVVLITRGPVWAVILAALVGGGGGSVFGVLWSSALQRQVPHEVLGRVTALDYVGQLGLEPLGLGVTAPCVASIGLSPVLVVGAASLLVTTGLPFLVPGVRHFASPVGSATSSEAAEHA